MISTSSAPRRRFLQFGLKTLLLLNLVSGAACALFAAKLDRKERERAAVAEIHKVGGSVTYDWELVSHPDIKDSHPPGPAWLRQWLGDDFFSDVVWVSLSGDDVTGEWLRRLEPLTELTQAVFIWTHITDDGLEYLARCRKIVQLTLEDETITDAGLACLRELPALRHLYISGASGVTDAGLIDIASLKRLEMLELDGTSVTGGGVMDLRGLPMLKGLWLRDTAVTDAGLAHFNDLKGLQELLLDGTGITDDGVACLSGLMHLRELSLQRTAVTDAGLVHLRPLAKLRVLRLSKTSVTIEGATQLQAALPNCQVDGFGWSRPANRGVGMK
jgi:hypothetical protein